MSRPCEGPDLVGVVGNNGVVGFVYREDLKGPSSLEEVAEYQAERGDESQVLTVYDVEGVAAVDTFTLVDAEVIDGRG